MSWTLITGGARRLGAAIALALAEKGRDIVVHFRTSEKEAAELVRTLRQKGVQAEALQGDFATLDSTQDFVQRYQKKFKETDGLVCNVGTHMLGSALETRPDDLYALLQTNVGAALALIQGLLPSIVRLKGQIVTIGMVGCGEIRANTHAFAYNLAKNGLCMLTKSLAKELAPKHIRVNMVSPGYMEESVDLPDKQNHLPMGRLAQHVEVARAVAFLMDPDSAYITAQNIEVAGGIRL